MSKTIIREVSPGLHTFSREFSRFGIFKIGARSALLKLKDGTYAITSPISIKDDKEPLEYVKRLGTISLIIAPDLAHYLSVPQWIAEFPAAKVIGVDGHATKLKDVKWDYLFTPTSDRTYPNTLSDAVGLEFAYFSGFKGRDLVVLHKLSKAIVEADLVFNLPALEQYGYAPGGCSGLMNGLRKDSSLSQKFVWFMGADKANMSACAKQVNAWDFEIIVPCHGNLIMNGKETWSFVFRRYLAM